jgi:hypothetical protein
MRYVTVATFLIALCLSSTAFGAANPNGTWVLHASPGLAGGCTTAPNQPDCAPGGVQPRVDIAPSEMVRVFFYLNNVANVAALDCAWDWTDSWIIDPNETGVTYTACTTNTLTLTSPQNPGGPQAGRLVTAFDCLTGMYLRIGRMDFAAGANGCLEFVEVQDTFGTHLVDCANGRDEYNPGSPNPVDQRFGKVCVTSGGINSCQPPVAVEPATWGSIKATYGR